MRNKRERLYSITVKELGKIKRFTVYRLGARTWECEFNDTGGEFESKLMHPSSQTGSDEAIKREIMLLFNVDRDADFEIRPY